MLNFPENYPSGLASLADCLYRQLLLSIPPDRSAALALKMAEAVRKEFAGSLIYIGRGDCFDRDQRNAAIVRDFDGHNHRALSKRYKVSMSCIYDVLKNAKSSHLAGPGQLDNEERMAGAALAVE